jgi:NarL family two-component system sensor histidine kinase YdfH
MAHLRSASATSQYLPENSASHTRLFLRVSLLTIGGFYVWVLALKPTPPGVIWNADLVLTFTMLLAAHAALHWGVQYVPQRSIWILIYLFIQTGLLFAMSQLLHYPALMALLYAPLLGEGLGIFEAPVLTVLMTLTLYGLYAVSFDISFKLPGVESIVIQSVILALLGSLPYVAALALQVQSRQRADHLLRELDTAHRQLVAYAEQVEELTLAAERARMARDLHDTLAQGVVGLILQLEALEGQLERDDVVQALQVTAQIKSRAKEVLANSRRAIDDLRIAPAQADALSDAIRKEVERFSAITRIPYTLDMPPSLVLPTSITEHALRCVAEGLANIARHARASHVNVLIGVQETSILIQIQDNGIGFDPLVTAQQNGHYGLLGLRERARLTGGSLDVDSAVGAGTTLRLRLPMLVKEGPK